MTLRNALALALVITACGGTATDSTSTPTTVPVASSTTQAEVTTTTLSTTTSSTTTTVPTVPDGVAVISSQGAVMGIWDGSWRVVEDPADLPPVGTTWQVFSEPGVPPDPQSAPILDENLFCDPVGLSRPLVGFEFGQPWLAVQATWPLVPHEVEDFTGQLDVYVNAVRDLLAGRGLEVDNVYVNQLIRLDLEGDGVDEVIVVATEGERADLYTPATDQPFEVVILRKVIAGDVETAVLALRLPEEILSDQGSDLPPFAFLLEYRVIAVADLNGDGKMEIALRDMYFEGAGLSIWEYVNDDLGPVRVLDLGCGV